MKNLTCLILMLGLLLAGFTSTAASARKRLSKQIEGQDYVSDVEVLEKSQEVAINLAKANLEKLKDPEDKKKMLEAIKLMTKAGELITEAKSSRRKFDDVVRQQEQAFQILLELVSKEHRITRSQQGKPSQGQPAGIKNQMRGLEMKMRENKYESKRLAEAEEEQSQEQREALQFLNRLRELAQRQGDINERLKELQTELQTAKDEKEKEEVRRQLKRLLEEQKRILEDIDELNQRMEQSPNQERMAEAQKELQQARNSAQRSAKSMESEQVSKALASGARAEESFKDLKEDFRKATAGKFAQDLRHMRAEIRELTEKQKELNKQLEGESAERGRKSLTAENKDDVLAQELTQQNEKLGELLQHAEQVSRQSEYAEPLLYRQLYDAIRNQTQAEAKNIGETANELQSRRLMTTSIYRLLQEAGEENKPKSLDIAAELARIGFKDSALPIGERSQDNLEKLQEKIEKAAESVLGNEADSLRMARSEIDELMRQFGGELQKANQRQMQTNQLAMAGASAGQQQREGARGEEQSGEQQGQQSGQQESKQGRQQGKGQGQQPGEQQEQQSGQQESKQGRQQGQGQGQQSGEQQGQQSDQQESKQGRQQGQGQGQQPGQQSGQQQSEVRQPGQGQGQNQPGRQGGPQQRGVANSDRGGNNGGWGNILPTGADQSAEHERRNAGPITGEGFADWADRIRNVEEMVSTDRMRNELSAVRERVRGARIEFKRHSLEPKWALLNESVMSPLVEIRDEISAQLARINSREAMVPIDRDPVPTRFAEQVRRYYEKLGQNR